MRREARANIRLYQTTWTAYERAAAGLDMSPTALMRRVIEGAIPAIEQISATMGAGGAHRQDARQAIGESVTMS